MKVKYDQSVSVKFKYDQSVSVKKVSKNVCIFIIHSLAATICLFHSLSLSFPHAQSHRSGLLCTPCRCGSQGGLVRESGLSICFSGVEFLIKPLSIAHPFSFLSLSLSLFSVLLNFSILLSYPEPSKLPALWAGNQGWESPGSLHVSSGHVCLT